MNTTDKPKTLFAVSKEYLERLANRAMNPVIPTGFSVIDNFVGGLQSPQVILLAGRPCAGKTALILNLAMNIARNDSIPVAIFSPGLSAAQLVFKIFNQNGIDSSRFRDTSKLFMEDLSIMSKVEDTLKELPLFIDDTQFQTLEEFAYKIGKLVNEEGVKVIFIDQIHLLVRPVSLSSRVEHVLILQTLRQLAYKYSITVVASISNDGLVFSRSIDLLEFERVGFPQNILEEYVDIAAILDRPGLYGKVYEDDTAEIMILHNRNGRRDITLDLQFVPDLYSFQDVPKKENEGFCSNRF